MLREMLGSATVPFQFPELLDNKLLSSMRGKHVVIDSDAGEPGRADAKRISSKFRTITSNEPVSVPLLWQQTPWTGPLGCKLLLATNSLLYMGDDSGATTGRWVPLVFDKSFLNHEDPLLFDRLVRELPAVTAWAAEGLQRLVARRRFVLPRSSLDTLDRTSSVSSPIVAFIDDMLTFGSDHRIADTALYNAYSMWATSNAVEPMAKRYFVQAVCDACQGNGVRWAKSVNVDGKVVRGFYGVSLGNVVPIRSATS